MLIYSSHNVVAEVVWTDDFEDGNYNNWDVATYYMDCSDICPWESVTPTVSVEGGELVIDSTTHTKIGVTWAIRDASVSYGRWSYDMNMISTTHDGFGFSMSEKDNAFNFSGVTSVSINFTGYLLFTLNYHNTELDDLIQTPGFGLYKWLPNGTLGGTWEDQYELLANISMSDVGITTTGIYHIDIIRKNDGNITVSLDGQKIMSVVDNTYTTSEKVMLWSWLGKTKYDNFNVSKEDVPTTSLSTSSTSNDTASKEIDSSLSIASTFICISLLPVIRRTRK